VTIKDHFFHSNQPVTYAKAVERAQEIAGLRRADRIVLEPPPGE
jgi:hypothetical protein